MAETWQNAVADAKIGCPAFPIYTDAVALRFGNRVHKELVEEFRLMTTTADLTLTTTDREYALDETHVAIWAADYLTTATATPYPLSETSVDELDTEDPGWRDPNISGIPELFYQYQNSTGGAVVGFDRLPSTASTAGYPTVRIYVSLYTALVSGSSLPAVIRTSKVYSLGLCAAWSELRDPEKFPYWNERYKAAKDELGVYVSRRQRRNEPVVRTSFGFGVAAS
jgi:hypothetical protein